MKYTLLAVDVEKKHVTFETEDGIKNTVGDFPVDDSVALEQALVNYVSQYHSPIEEKSEENKEVKAMIGQEKQVVSIKVDESVTPKAFDAKLTLEDVKDIIVSETTVEVAEAVVTDSGIEITTVKPEQSVDEFVAPVVEDVVTETPAEEAVVETPAEVVPEVMEPVTETVSDVVDPVIETPVEEVVSVVEETPVELSVEVPAETIVEEVPAEISITEPVPEVVSEVISEKPVESVA